MAGRAEPEKPKEKRVEKTKEELAVIRKQMMKQRPSTSSSQPSMLNNSSGVESSLDSSKQQPKNSELMQRLARGEKAEVSKRDMLKLTNKNYE